MPVLFLTLSEGGTLVALFSKRKVVEEAAAVVPAHLGIIMDGNGRWA